MNVNQEKAYKEYGHCFWRIELEFEIEPLFYLLEPSQSQLQQHITFEGYT